MGNSNELELSFAAKKSFNNMFVHKIIVIYKCKYIADNGVSIVYSKAYKHIMTDKDHIKLSLKHFKYCITLCYLHNIQFCVVFRAVILRYSFQIICKHYNHRCLTQLCAGELFKVVKLLFCLFSTGNEALARHRLPKPSSWPIKYIHRMYGKWSTLLSWEGVGGVTVKH